MINKRTNSPFVAKSKSSKADEETFLIQLLEQRGEWDRMTTEHTYPIKVVFLFRRATKRIFDYVNMAQGILDAMVKAEYFPDDNADYVIPVFLPYVVDKSNPGCDVTIGD